MRLHQILLDAAARTPDKTALTWVNRERSLTYKEAVAGMLRVAGGLSALGVRKGDRVGVVAHNGLDYVLAMLGTWRLGAISALVSVQYRESLDYFLNDCEPSVLIYTGDIEASIKRVRPNVGSIRHYVCLDGPQEGAIPWSELLNSEASPPPDRTEDGDIAHLSYTSGSSGKPKGVCIAHEPTARATRCIADRLRIQPNDVCYGPTALSSSYHLVANLLPSLHQGATAVLAAGFDSGSGWQSLERWGATVLVANPLILAEVLRASADEGKAPSQLRIAISGGGPVPADLKQRWRDELRIPLVESYGQSELGGFVALGYPEIPTDPHLSVVGQPLPDKEVRIFGPDDTEVAPGEAGEIVLRGGYMVGYWARPDQTAEALRGDWLHTGDVGYLDRENYLTLRGRLSERVVVADTVWYPRDVEEALLRHPAIKEAAVVGAPGGASGQRLRGFVTLVPGAPDVNTTELYEFVTGQLQREPKSLSVVVIGTMPMTPTGKIAKTDLLALEPAR